MHLKKAQKLLGKSRQTSRQQSERAFLNPPFLGGLLRVHRRPSGLPGEPPESPISAAQGTAPVHNPLPCPDLSPGCVTELPSRVWDAMKTHCSSCTGSFLLPLASSLHHAGVPRSSPPPSPFPAAFSTSLGTSVNLWGAVALKSLLLEHYTFFQGMQLPNQEQRKRQATSIAVNGRKSQAGAVGSTH